MNSAEFNMLLLAGLAVAVLIGKFIFEHVMTRKEEREAALKAQVLEGSQPNLARRG
jgi:hypothetical protein